jgi:hypothetical protein
MKPPGMQVFLARAWEDQISAYPLLSNASPASFPLPEA